MTVSEAVTFGSLLRRHRLAVSLSQEALAERAALLLGAAEHLRFTMGAPLPPCWRAGYERTMSSVRAQLSAAAFESAWAAGRALTQDRAVGEVVAYLGG